MWKKVIAVLIGIVIGYWFIDDFDPDSLKGKRVLVTGASTGIGEQIAYLYARFGASVVVTARRQQQLQQVVARCRELGDPTAIFGYVVADMANLSSTEHVIQDAVQQLGGLDILVLNHIIPHNLGPWTSSAQNLTLLQRLLVVNLQSYVHLTSHALPHLTESNGSIIVMSSLAGKVGIPFVAAYSSTKFALNGFFASLRNELIISDTPVSITLCTIGLVGTENALHYLKEFGSRVSDTMRSASPADVALAVIKGGAQRTREVSTLTCPREPFAS
ncbi:hypothetical protein C0Q70_03194 [Pomacea canaliculata]|uniref:Hydroxysteroid 11-beta-dehydrogenase 1-like protein n=1 Tax=Pomacea canaliculata TaxID=400727 RepID=A0A2T7PS25_POMCA|nr:hydroxysteroid 11-beta-dehydrogenase 1-like protein [Pomacea canaliculata]XP_025084173.1 hydroxysteroid 11-beta-dehydrogenase 1-like protein [Pomacea canaliculata]XP_025084174.1 hydroxysteroid 11-beta-dehydrogenase 1-like protein [Pomacea canaliculata]XP_025084175.1 hydroxysteroid 11-beta-dehydrogenase 1-like protein [Pomacea canaliculata]XP_025084176.1 hydroxysteroid 11-beta-dehydrogenase 1-like protein [Pomacea canaliculata]PVD36218.1 hypothetical protein C0Q70_03194 [Pomacea canaliculata